MVCLKMNDNSDYSTGNLEHCSYRYLQQVAKSMKLPSNVKALLCGGPYITNWNKLPCFSAKPVLYTSKPAVSMRYIFMQKPAPLHFHVCSNQCSIIQLHWFYCKKVHLIEMIKAKKSSPEHEVERLVRRIKQQRKHQAQAKRKRQRAHIATMQVDSSDSEASSHPITITPKRPIVVRCTPDVRQAIMRSQASLIRSSTTNPKPTTNLKPITSDRVLRSFNIKTVTPVTKETKMQEATLSMRMVRKYKPNILANSKDRQLIPVSQMPAGHVLMKRPRLLSGIYPLGRDLGLRLQSVGVRNSDGKMATINAIVHKPRTEDKCNQTALTAFRTNMEVAIQDILNSSLDAPSLEGLHYPNASGVSEPMYPELQDSTSSVYYHKKIRGEQVRGQRMSAAPQRCELPRIHEAFQQFQLPPADLTQPLYVQISEESERILNYPSFTRSSNLLETVYNFRSQFLPGAPLLQLASAASTRCVYSTPTVATAAPQKPVSSTEPYTAFDERDSQYPYYGFDSSRMMDCFQFSEDYDFRCNEEHHTSSSSVGTAQSQELGADVTISDMVEDALELISQDGDYMERMGMDVRMQCVLCNWAGPKIILEYHIRKEHSNQIDKQDKRDWNITYSLGSLVRQQLWSCRVIEHDGLLYVLSVKHEQPDCFMATLSSLSADPGDLDPPTGSITVFNKVSGEPHSWRGAVRALPPSLPYHSSPDLRLDLTALDLLPNSANLKFLNGELVRQSPTKVVFGQDLNDIHIILFVRIFS